MDNRFARQANDTSIPIKSSVRLALLPRFIYCINLCPRLLKNSPLPKWVEINSEVEAFSHRLYVNIYFLNYRKVTSSRPVYYSILNSLGQRSQCISIKFPLLKQPKNVWVCFYPRQSTACNFTLLLL